MIPPKVKKAICIRAGGDWDGSCSNVLCETCGSNGPWPGLSHSHIIAKSRGGKDTEENIIIECNACHTRYEKNPEARLEGTLGYELYLAQIQGANTG